jgi:RecJ-like exonuclease
MICTSCQGKGLERTDKVCPDCNGYGTIASTIEEQAAESSTLFVAEPVAEEVAEKKTSKKQLKASLKSTDIITE